MLNRNVLRGLIAVALFVPASSAMSEGLSYNYIEASYATVSVDLADLGLPDDLDGTGYGFSGSFEIAPSVAITAGYGQINYERTLGVDIDEDSLTFGVTAYNSVKPGTDVGLNISILKAEWEATDGITTIGNDDTGTIFGVEIRHMVSNTIETGAHIERTDIFNDSSISYGFNGRIHTGKYFSLGASYSASEDSSAIGMNVRLDM